MTFGARLVDSEGNPFYIDGTMPLCLTNKLSFNLSGGGSNATQRTVDIHDNDGVVRFVFVCCTTPDTAIQYYINSSSGKYAITAYRLNGGAVAFEVYIFGYKYQDDVPKYGIAYWDKQNRCIIHSRTKVLRNVQTIGTPGSESSGDRINTSKAGKWAIAPCGLLGYMVGVIYQGSQPYPYASPCAPTAYYNGSSTNIKGVWIGGGSSGGGSNITETNYRNAIKCIDVSMY